MPYLTAIIIRLLVPLTMIRSPWWGFLLSLGIDSIDLEIILLSGYIHVPGFIMDYARYQSQDKWLDLYMFAIAVYVARLWPDTLAYRTTVVLFLLRCIGVVLFEITEIRWLLIVFPNVLEFFYIFSAFMFRYKPNFRIRAGKRLALILVIATLLKLPHEYSIHILHASRWNLLKDKIFN